MNSNHIFKKNYGQNFLRNGKFVTKLVEALNLTSDSTVLEIGPGEGILTNNILKTGAKIISVEIDYSLIPGLIKRFSEQSNFEIVNEDFLNLNLKSTFEKFNASNEIKVAGSLPYNISKKIIKKLIDFNLNQTGYFISKMSFIVQDEVAKEYVAEAPRASMLSNYIKLYANVRKLESIPASQFYPQPKVNGAILVIEPKKEVLKNVDEINKLIRIGYSAPRKTLLRNLKNSRKWDSDKLTEIFKELQIKETIRAAELGEDKWIELYNKLN